MEFLLFNICNPHLELDLTIKTNMKNYQRILNLMNLLIYFLGSIINGNNMPLK